MANSMSEGNPGARRRAGEYPADISENVSTTLGRRSGCQRRENPAVDGFLKVTIAIIFNNPIKRRPGPGLRTNG
jgi:hypothetical protein